MELRRLLDPMLMDIAGRHMSGSYRTAEDLTAMVAKNVRAIAPERLGTLSTDWAKDHEHGALIIALRFSARPELCFTITIGNGHNLA